MSKEFWKKFPTVPGFNCLEMKREIQAKIYDETKDLSSEELVAYFNRAGNDFRRRGRIEAHRDDPSLVKEKTAHYQAKQRRKD